MYMSNEGEFRIQQKMISTYFFDFGTSVALSALNGTFREVFFYAGVSGVFLKQQHPLISCCISDIWLSEFRKFLYNLVINWPMLSIWFNTFCRMANSFERHSAWSLYKRSEFLSQRRWRWRKLVLILGMIRPCILCFFIFYMGISYNRCHRIKGTGVFHN